MRSINGSYILLIYSYIAKFLPIAKMSVPERKWGKEVSGVLNLKAGALKTVRSDSHSRL